MYNKTIHEGYTIQKDTYMYAHINLQMSQIHTYRYIRIYSAIVLELMLWQEGLHVSQQPWTYFDNISVFDQFKLRPCTEAILGFVGDTYVNVTGDVDGVVWGTDPGGSASTLNRSLDVRSLFRDSSFKHFCWERKHLANNDTIDILFRCRDNVDCDFSDW